MQEEDPIVETVRRLAEMILVHVEVEKNINSVVVKHKNKINGK